MLTLTTDQVIGLIKIIGASRPDSLDCDGCFALIAEFAELEQSQGTLTGAMHKVKTHLEQCECCKCEYEALIAALNSDYESDYQSH